MNQTNNINIIRLVFQDVVYSITAMLIYLILQVLIGISVDFFMVILIAICAVPIIKYFKSSDYRRKLNNNFLFVLLEILIITGIYVFSFICILFIVGTY